MAAAPSPQSVTTDYLGHVRAVTDGAASPGGGAQRDYYPFGEPIPKRAGRPGREVLGGLGNDDGVVGLEQSQTMPVNVQIKPDVEAMLPVRARSVGESFEAYVQRLLEREASASAGAPCSPALAGAEKAAAFRAWAKSFAANMPHLSLEDLSREKVYERD